MPDTDDDLSPEAQAAWAVAEAIERDGAITSVDWNDLGEVTVRVNGKTFRAILQDITDEEA